MMGEWISVKDRLPKPEEWVIATNGEFVVEAGIFNGDWLRCGSPLPIKSVYSKLPTHWMPLPPPPEM